MKKRRDLCAEELFLLDTYTPAETARINTTDLFLAYTGNITPFTNATAAGNAVSMVNGQATIGELSIPVDIVIECWVALSGTSNLLSVGTSFKIDYTHSDMSITIIRYPSASNQEVFKITVPDLTTGWHHICINRVNTRLDLLIDGVIVNTINTYNYVIPNGTASLNDFNGSFKYLRISRHSYPLQVLTNLDNIDLELTPTALHTNPSRLLFNLKYQDETNSITILPSSKVSLSYQDQHIISPAASLSNIFSTLQGMAVVPSYDFTLPESYTLELIFSFVGNSDACLIYSDYPNWYIADVQSTLRLYYYVGAVLQEVTVGPLTSSVENRLSISFINGSTKLCLNNDAIVTVNTDLRSAYPFYRFNYGRPGILNSGTDLYLSLFRAWSYDKLVNPYVVTNTEVFAPRVLPYNKPAYKYKDDVPTVNTLNSNGIQVTCASASITASTNTIFTITRVNANNPVTVYLEYNFSQGTLPAIVLLNSNQFTNTFTVNLTPLSAYTSIVNFKVTARTDIHTASLTLPYLNNVALPTTPLLLGDMVDGYFLDVNPFVSLKARGTANSTATRTYFENYGFGLYLNNTNVFTLPNQATLVKTVVLLYKEQQPTPYRAYVGDTTTYSFNGGPNGELIGELQVDAESYIQALSVNGVFDNVKIAPNGNMFVAVQLNTNKVLVYTKTNNLWTTAPVELSLNLQSPNQVASAYIDVNTQGNVIAIGFRNANLGEGVVKVWRLAQGQWVEDLHLSSPVAQPVPGNFGHAVAISDNGLVLAVTELNSYKVYIYNKTTTWSSTPTQTITGTVSFGHNIALSTTGIYLFIGNSVLQDTKIYKYATGTFTLLQTIAYGYNFALDKSNNDLLISNYTANPEVKLYRFDTVDSWDLIKTFTGTGTFGSSISLSEGVVVIGDLDNDRVLMYKEPDNWVSSTVFTKAIDYYGVVVDVAKDLLVLADSGTVLDVLSADTSILQPPIVSIRSNATNSQPTELLYNNDINILFIQSSNNLTISSVGSNRAGGRLNGIFLGALFYSILLSEQQMITLETYLKKRLAILENSIL